MTTNPTPRPVRVSLDPHANHPVFPADAVRARLRGAKAFNDGLAQENAAGLGQPSPIEPVHHVGHMNPAATTRRDGAS